MATGVHTERIAEGVENNPSLAGAERMSGAETLHEEHEGSQQRPDAP